jgi:hypothetical protein
MLDREVSSSPLFSVAGVFGALFFIPKSRGEARVPFFSLPARVSIFWSLRSVPSAPIFRLDWSGSFVSWLLLRCDSPAGVSRWRARPIESPCTAPLAPSLLAWLGAYHTTAGADCPPCSPVRSPRPISTCASETFYFFLKRVFHHFPENLRAREKHCQQEKNTRNLLAGK